MKEKEKELRR